MAPLVAVSATPMRPSAAMRPAFLAALASPFLRRRSTAASMSPPVSPSADLQSIMPASVRSRSSLTIWAVTLAMKRYPVTRHGRACPGHPGLAACEEKTWMPGPRPGMTKVLLRRTFLCLSDPAFHAAGQADFLADGMGGVGAEPRDLPVMEDAEIVEFLLDRRRHVGELLEIVGDPARAGQHLVAR